MKRLLTVLAALASVNALSACGLASRGAGGPVTITVTRDFGARPLAATVARQIGSSETALTLLRRSFGVTLSPAGSVQAIDGRSGGKWFLYVNGISPAGSAARTTVHAGDRVWWDLHDPTAAASNPAVVGSFPEPFVHGSDGRRLPVTLECGPGVGGACARAASVLGATGVPVARQLLGTGSGQDSITVEVATWSELQGEIAATLIGRGPSASGVYARFTGRTGRTLELLDARGHPARVLGPGAGLIAATGDNISQPTWLITGTDLAGVSAAAAALNTVSLRNHFAVAIDRDSAQPLPVATAARGARLR